MNLQYSFEVLRIAFLFIFLHNNIQLQSFYYQRPRRGKEGSRSHMLSNRTGTLVLLRFLLRGRKFKVKVMWNERICHAHVPTHSFFETSLA